MNKWTAAAIINREGLAKLNPNNNGNVSWANINLSKDVWWVDIPVKKFRLLVIWCKIYSLFSNSFNNS